MKQWSVRTVIKTNTEVFLKIRRKKNKVTNRTCCLLFGSDHVTTEDIKNFLSAAFSPWIGGYNMAFVVVQH